ncbi:alpha/beta hydrolase [Sneathiella sp.]|uniref:alpha/beta hydrolase n=1 Tax=Sneathiella sp. TaxID=1964365 RepID=UPI0035622C5E
MILKLALFIAVSVAIYFAIALALIFSQSSEARVANGGLDFSRQLQRGTDSPQPLQSYRASDGQELFFRRYESRKEGAPLLVLVHGSGWHGLAFDQLARSLAAKEVADVIVPDLRGHGVAPAHRGDIAYTGQLEDDLHDLIKAERKSNQKVALGGHSSGGGLVIRFAGGEHAADIDGAILLAPFLKYNAPTTRQNSGGWATALTRRIIGLSMLNKIGITALNYLPIIDFAFPDAVLDGPLGQTVTRSYSFRLNQSLAPRSDYLKDISRLPPFILIAGKEDEAFIAELYEPTISAVTAKGEYVLLEGVSHLDVMYDPQTAKSIADFLSRGF